MYWMLMMLYLGVPIENGKDVIMPAKIVNVVRYETEQECQRAIQAINRTAWETDLIAVCIPRKDQPESKKRIL